MQRTHSLEKTLMLGKIKAGKGDDRGWDGWIASPTQWSWVWARSGSWWWTGKSGVLQSKGSQRVWHDWATELNLLTYLNGSRVIWPFRGHLSTSYWLKKEGKRELQAKFYLGAKWGQPQETAPQITLRKCSKEVGVRSLYMWFWWRESTCNQAHIFMRRFLLVSGSFLSHK